MTACLGFMKPFMLPSAALCFCHHDEDEDVSGLPQGESEKRGAVLPQLMCPGQAQPWAKSQPAHSHMVKSSQNEQSPSWPTDAWDTIINVSSHRALVWLLPTNCSPVQGRDLMATKNSSRSFPMVSVFPQVWMKHHGWTQGALGRTQDSEKHWITQGECYSTFSSSVLIILRTKSQLGTSTLQLLSNTC